MLNKVSVHYIIPFIINERVIMMNNEQQILDDAIHAFNADKKIQIRIGAIKPKREPWDAGAIIKLGNDEYGIRTQVKKWVNHVNRGALLREIRKLKAQNREGKTLLATDYVNPNLAMALREENINYIDAVGNAFLAIGPIYIDIQGRKPHKPAHEKVLGTALQPKGLKVVYILLAHQEMLNMAFRDIAKAAKVALGTVKNVFDDLKAQGYIAGDKTHERYWLKKQKLLNLWVTMYPQQIKAKHNIEKFETDKMFWYDGIDVRDFEAFMGGEEAAAELTNYLNPGTTQIYIEQQNINAIAKRAYLRRARGVRNNTYTIEFLEPFVDVKYMKNGDYAHPLIIYANLIDIADPRTVEVAELIYDKYLNKTE